MLDGFEQRRAALVGELEQCVALAAEVGAKSLASRLESEVVEKLRGGKFHLVVVGEFNHGKTSFVNALLGRSVLPVGVTPTTALIHHVVYAAEPTARLVYAGGAERELPVNELQQFAVQDGDAGAASEPGRAPGSDRAEPSYVELGYPSALLDSGVLLVDTPGVNDLSLTRAEITYGYIPRADAVLFLIDAGQPLKESERAFLEQQLLERSRDKIVFVVTKADIWTPDERAQALEYVSGRLARLVKGPQVFAVSSELELKRVAAGADAADAGAETGFAQLLQYLQTFLAENRGKILLDNAAGEGQRALASVRHGIETKRRSASLSLTQLERRLAALEGDLEGQAQSLEERRLELREAAGAIKAGARRDLTRFVDETLVKLPELVAEASGEEVRLHLGAFIEQAFKAFLERQARQTAAELETLSERMVVLVSDDSRRRAERLSEVLGATLKSPSVEVNTFAYDFGILAVMTVGLGTLFANVLLGGALLVAAPVLALWHRGRTEREIKRRAQELIPGALRSAAEQVAPQLDAMVDEFVRALDEWVTQTSRELHIELVEVLRTARDQRLAEAQGQESLEAQAAALESDLERLMAALDGYRAAPAE